jgi:hypothetical protein
MEEIKMTQHAIVIIGDRDGSGDWQINEENKGMHFIDGLITWGWDPADIKIFGPATFPPPHTPVSAGAVKNYIENIETEYDRIVVYIYEHVVACPGADEEDLITFANDAITLGEWKGLMDHLDGKSGNLIIICNGKGSGCIANKSHKQEPPAVRTVIGSYLNWPEKLDKFDAWDHFDYGLAMKDDNINEYIITYYQARNQCIDRCMYYGITPVQDPFILLP